ncbi:hypothetical protein RYA60_01865 [Pseudomonas syringae]|nr:hypothetical protein [Pseudomonas syringae]
MSLGSFFPADFARMQIERQLQPGVVVKFSAEMDDGKVHEKRFVVLDASENTFTCVINSRISRFIASDANKLKCQVAILASQHPFMSWDSHVDCSRVRTYSRAEVIDQLCTNPEWILGVIALELRDEIVGALKASRTIPATVIAHCCASLSQAN